MSYIHGFDEIEQKRLVTQSKVLEDIIFEKIDFTGRDKILEVGCGVGAQTEILLNKYPSSHITGIELSEVQLNTAKTYVNSKFDTSRFSLNEMNAEEMMFEDNSFDAIYICWVLEHVKNPQKVIDECYRVLKKGGVISISEVQNNSLFFVPESKVLSEYWNKYNTLQIEMGGNPFVGVEIGNFLFNSHFSDIETYPRGFILDNNSRDKRNIMVDYWCNLMLSGFDELVENNSVLLSEKDLIISEINKVKEENGVFHYTFIQGKASKNN